MNGVEKEKLTEFLADMLPGGRMVRRVLPGCREINLYLLDKEGPGTILDKAQAARLAQEPMFWLFCWASGQALARYILDHPWIVQGKKVLDFGCGSGVAAIAAARAGAEKVWASDLDPRALQAAAANCALNAVRVEFMGDWQSCPVRPDVVLAADVLYDSANMSLPAHFTGFADEVLLADSRIGHPNSSCYRRIFRRKSFTVPDLGEPAERGWVSIYHAGQRRFLDESHSR